MRFRAPSMRTQTILLLPIIIPAVPLLYLMVALTAAWHWLYGKIAPSSEWHPWFAWRPVRHFNDVDWMWLEWTERMWHGHGVGCIYRFPEDREGR